MWTACPPPAAVIQAKVDQPLSSIMMQMHMHQMHMHLHSTDSSLTANTHTKTLFFPGLSNVNVESKLHTCLHQPRSFKSKLRLCTTHSPSFNFPGTYPPSPKQSAISLAHTINPPSTTYSDLPTLSEQNRQTQQQLSLPVQQRLTVTTAGNALGAMILLMESKDQ
jgi:hypothetical protein